ncbi:Oidioi.mRNA.OKI2018_I69.chr2.g6484.t1.cds [Oikopleura dioica]|uniref:Oidioi.mRNA.OKI2018_I69.PAR.g8581.t1.cds n=1 Tax=Oikopleura dioica TaxID=34765 RepID=A0ABN7TA86_OIKDI|nr:Oidioi.mRNA.OKI2018_I69.PAR.g8581.t1.cds [Oikopleura dioica]CAG5112249.1 Oidioi.mRNA.OKI2018_I69.chr2.g6484.t1.cds [Oikopleura dioica]
MLNTEDSRAVLRTAFKPHEFDEKRQQELGPSTRRAIKILQKLEKDLDELSSPSLMGELAHRRHFEMEAKFSEAVTIQSGDEYGAKGRRLQKAIPLGIWNCLSGRMDVYVRLAQVQGEVMASGDAIWFPHGYPGDEVHEQDQQLLNATLETSLQEVVELGVEIKNESDDDLLPLPELEFINEPGTSSGTTSRKPKKRVRRNAVSKSAKKTSSLRVTTTTKANKRSRQIVKEVVSSESDEFETPDSELLDIMEEEVVEPKKKKRNARHH